MDKYKKLDNVREGLLREAPLLHHYSINKREDGVEGSEQPRGFKSLSAG